MKLKRFVKPRFVLLYPLALAVLLYAHTTERQLHAGIVLALLGLALRIWANGYVGHVKVNWTQKWRGDVRIGRLVTAGPYAFVRHPLYLGSALIGAGMFVIAGNVWLSLLALLFFLVVYRQKMAEEEALLGGELGAEYLIYQAAVPRWLPSWRRYGNRQGTWRWQGILASKEWKTDIWVLVLLITLYLREEILQEREAFFQQMDWKHAVLVGLMAALILTDLFIECQKRWPMRSPSNA